MLNITSTVEPLLIDQRNKKRAECIVELYKHAGLFKNTREVPEKHEPQANASRTSRHEEQVFYFFYKILTNKIRKNHLFVNKF